MLVVDDSEVYLRVVSILLKPYCPSVLTARNVGEAIQSIESNPDIEAVLCDVVLGDESGFEVLEYVASRSDLELSVVMVTAYPADTGAARARRLGAVDYLTKPTSMRRILRALRSADSPDSRMPPRRSRCAGKAHLLDGESEAAASMAWDIHNISLGGAFLETKGPIPIGSELDLALYLRGGKAEVRARVVRVQDPSWLDIAGVGVRFIELGEDADAVLRRTLALSDADLD
jgi:CheY-like chemotaxis protein